MGLLTSAYHMSRMAQMYFPAVQNLVDKMMNKYVSSIEPEEWTDKVASIDTEGMSYKEKQESRELAIQTAGVMEGQCDNLAQAIQEDPVAWGAYLQEKGMDEEKLEEIQQKVAEDGSVPPFELVKLAIGGSSQTEKSSEKQIDTKLEQPTEPAEEQEKESDAEAKTKSQVAMMEEELGSVPESDDVSTKYNFGEYGE